MLLAYRASILLMSMYQYLCNIDNLNTPTAITYLSYITVPYLMVSVYVYTGSTERAGIKHACPAVLDCLV